MRSDSRKNCKNKKIEDPSSSEIHEQFDLFSLLKGKYGNSMLDEKFKNYLPVSETCNNIQ